MNILIINHYAGSPDYGMEFRPFYLASEWIRLGHKVTIVSASYSHLRLKNPRILKGLFSEKIHDVTYIWIKTPKYNTLALARIINIVSFLSKLILFQKKILKITKPDVVIASSTYPLDIYPAFYFAKKSKAKLVFELHDLWPLSPMIIGGYSKFHPYIWLMQKAENFACRNTDCYVSLLGNAENYLLKHGLSAGKFIHIPNGFSLIENGNFHENIPLSHENSLRSLRSENKILIGYAGGHAPSNALNSLLEVAKILTSQENIVFVLVGDGSEKQELIKKASYLNLNNIIFLPPVKKNAIPQLLSFFDILYAGGIKSYLHSFGTSFNKITDYMLSSKPIIFAVDEPNSIVQKSGCGIQVPAEDISEICKAVLYLCERSNEERSIMGFKGEEYAMAELSYASLAKKFIAAIEVC
jgi:glycosyltransferase involved in cell wall biosynthesis